MRMKPNRALWKSAIDKKAIPKPIFLTLSIVKIKEGGAFKLSLITETIITH